MNGPHNAPYAQKLDLGWVIVGDVCIGDIHKPPLIHSYSTNVLRNRHLFQPCPNSYMVKERYCGTEPLSQPLQHAVSQAQGIQNTSESDMFQEPKRTTHRSLPLKTCSFWTSWAMESTRTRKTAGWLLCLPELTGNSCLTIVNKHWNTLTHCSALSKESLK